MPKLIYLLDHILALIFELTLLLNETATLEKFVWGPASLAQGQLTATDCSAIGAWGEWSELGCVLSANASTTACFTSDEMNADSAVILTVIC